MCKMAKKIDIFCLSPLCKGSSIVEEGNRSALDGRGYADPRLVIGSLPLRTTIRNGDKEEVCYTILSGRLADVASCKQLGPEAVTFYDAQDSKFACKAAEKKTQLLAEAGARDLNIAGLRNIQIHPQIQPKYSLARCRPNTPKYRQIHDVAVAVFACACIRLSHRYLKLGSAFALPFAHVFGGRRRRRRGLASKGRAVSLAAALVSAPLVLPAGGDAGGGARRMWDRGDV